MASSARLVRITAEFREEGLMKLKQKRLQKIAEIIRRVENRCMAVDGPVTTTRTEMTDDELRRIYFLTVLPAPKRRKP